jgi:hypothetical protein
LARDSVNEEQGFQWKYVGQALTDAKLYMMVLIYLGTNSSLYALSFFLYLQSLRTLIEVRLSLPVLATQTLSNPCFLSFNVRAQLLTVPPYACACVTVLLSAYISDKFQKRGLVNVVNFTIAIVGFIVLETTKTPEARYAGTFLAAIGAFPGIAITIAWNANNIQNSPTKRAVGIAMQSSAGSCGGIIGSWM